MKITVTIEISDSVFRGLVAESEARGVTVNERVAECVVECVPPLKHKHDGDWTRASIRSLPEPEYAEVRRRAVIHKADIEAAIRRYVIQKHHKTVGLRVIQQEFQF